MKRKVRIYVLSIAILVWPFLTIGFGADPGNQGEKKSSSQKIFKEDTGRNPFSDTELIHREAEQKRMGPVSVTSKLPEGIPNLLLRGYIEGNNKKSAALLEIQGSGVYVIHEGDSLNLHSGQQNILLKVREIRNMNAIVGVGVRGQEIIVR